LSKVFFEYSMRRFADDTACDSFVVNLQSYLLITWARCLPVVVPVAVPVATFVVSSRAARRDSLAKPERALRDRWFRQPPRLERLHCESRNHQERAGQAKLPQSPRFEYSNLAACPWSETLCGSNDNESMSWAFLFV